MPISSLSPRNVARRVGDASNSRAVKVLDWATALAFLAYAAWLLAREWPDPSAYALAWGAASLLGLVLAAYDWKPRLRAAIEARLIGRFVRRRG
jgi:hypothetical protein